MATGLWLDFTRNSMQRLGYMKVLVNLVPSDHGIDSNALINKFFTTVSNKVSVDITKNLYFCKSLIDKKLLSFRYNSINRAVIDKVLSGEQISEPSYTSIEIQDLYLSDYTLPSITGAITQDVQGEPLNLAIQIGLLRDKNHGLLSLGNMLKVNSPNILQSFNMYDETSNPFALTLADKIILLYALLSSDIDIITRILRIATDMKNFDRGSIGDRIPEILEEIIKLYQPKAITQTDRTRITRLKEISKSVEKMIGKPSGGTGRAREQFITPRLEHLVELGFLVKVNQYGYEYKICDQIPKLQQYLSLLERDNACIDRIFFSLVNLLYYCNADKIESQGEICKTIKEHSVILRDAVGYSSIVETIIDSNIALLERGKYFEIGDGVIALEEYQKQNPRKLRFMIDRSGKTSYFKFME